MGVQIASYNACNLYNIGLISASVGSNNTLSQGSGDVCGDCGLISNATVSSSVVYNYAQLTITIPFSQLIYNPQNVWITITGELTASCSISATVTFTFQNSSGSTLATNTATIPSTGNFAISEPVPDGTATITITAETTEVDCNSTISIANILFFSQPVEYYMNGLFFYNQQISYTITFNLTESGYISVYPSAGGVQNAISSSLYVTTSAGNISVGTALVTSVTSLSEFVATVTANNTYQSTWSIQIPITYLTSSCQLYQILVVNLTGYNNILNPSLQQFTIQTPFNGTITKSYTLLVPAGYFKILPSYALSCSVTPCTTGFTTFTITIDIETSSGVIIQSQQINVLDNEQFVTFNLEDYYAGQTLTVVITLDINASLSQNVSLAINFEYESQATP